MCDTFGHNFKNIPLYIKSSVSLERHHYVFLYDDPFTLKVSKKALRHLFFVIVFALLYNNRLSDNIHIYFFKPLKLNQRSPITK